MHEAAIGTRYRDVGDSTRLLWFLGVHQGRLEPVTTPAGALSVGTPAGGPGVVLSLDTPTPAMALPSDSPSGGVSDVVLVGGTLAERAPDVDVVANSSSRPKRRRVVCRLSSGFEGPE